MIRVGAILAFLCSSALAKQNSQVHGRIVDPASAAIAGSARIMRIRDSVTLRRATATPDGAFPIDGLTAGKYRIAVWAGGFRPKFGDIELPAGTDLDLGVLMLPLAGCDATGVICDSFGGEDPDSKSVIVRKTLEIFPNTCAVDLDKGDEICTVILDAPQPTSPGPDKVSDIWIRTSQHEVTVVTRNGARFTRPNTADSVCRGAPFDATTIRIDGLGPGGEFCVRTTAGHLAHVFLASEVDATEKKFKLSFVTRR